MKRRVSATDALSAQGKEMAASQRMLLLLYGLAIKASTSEWWSRRCALRALCARSSDGTGLLPQPNSIHAPQQLPLVSPREHGARVTSIIARQMPHSPTSSNGSSSTVAESPKTPCTGISFLALPCGLYLYVRPVVIESH